MDTPASAFQVSPTTLAVFATPASPQAFAYGSSSRGLRSAFRVWRSRPAALLSLGSSSHEVPSPLGAFGRVGPLVTPGANPESPSALRFLQPLGGLLPTHLAGLFHPASTCRLSPSGLLLPRSRIVSRRPLTLLPLPSSRLPLPGDRTPTRLQGFALLGASTRFRHTVKRDGAQSPLGVLALQGLLSLGRGSSFNVPPLTSLDARRRDVAASASQGISAPSEWQVSRETASPLELPGLFDLLIHSEAQPDLAYRFASGPTSRRRDTRASLRSVLAPYRS